MKTLSTLILSTTFLALAGCMGSGTKELAQNPNGTVIPQKVEEGVFTKTPRPDVIGDSSALASAKKIIVPFYKIQFNKSAGESASASVGFTGPSTNVHVQAKLSGVDESVFKRITNASYQDLISKLKDQGFNIVNLDTYKNSKAYSSLDNDFPDIDDDKSIYLASEMRDEGSVFYTQTWGELTKETGAAVISGFYVVDFAAFGTDSSDRYDTASASVSLGQVAHVWGGLNGIANGKYVKSSLGQATYSKIPMGEFTDTTSDAVAVTQGVLNVLASLSGTSTRTDTEKTLAADSNKYEMAVMVALKEANTRLVNNLKNN